MIAALLLALSAQAPAPSPACDEREEATRDRAVRVAVYDLEAANVDAHVGRVVTESVVAEVRKLDRVVVVGMSEVRALLDLEAQKQLAGCSEDSCLAEIADALGVDLVVTGTLARVGEEHVFGLKLVDARAARTASSYDARLAPAGGEEFLAAVGPAVEKLFPGRPLRPGATRGVPAEIALRLNPPPIPAWAFWSGVGGTAVLAATGGALTTVWALRQNDFATLREQDAVSGALVKQRTDELLFAEGLMWTAWGVAGAAAVVVAATAFFTDFAGYGED